ncbi:unnamed protein product [Trypanosoma congolense IL3000]|uniref:WGS project CAEQ00000000 data, annotated contig 1871 n=1 Tax=Trypanosoma congolense (strain IL3000) TaxID=1068625 RepID=F9W9J9_TRYCI|nr:unnamed protein product [Trypanosoma congolense IL3000]
MRSSSGVVSRTLPLRFAWRQNYTALLPPSSLSVIPSAYICGRLLHAQHYGEGSKAATIVLESPSDSAGLATVKVNTTEGAARALREVMRGSKPLSYAARHQALERMGSVLTRNAELLASAEALSTGVCLHYARQSVGAAIDFVANCVRLLPGHPSSAAGIESERVSEIHHALHCRKDNAANVALCCSAAKYSLQWGVEVIAAALSRGCAALWLPSLEAPLSALWLMHLLQQSAVDANNTVSGDGNGATDGIERLDGRSAALPCDPINIMLYRGDHEDLIDKALSERDVNEVPVLLGLSNGFTARQLSSLFSLRGDTEAPTEVGLGVLKACAWHHHVVRPMAAIVVPAPQEVEGRSSPALDTTAAVVSAASSASASARAGHVAEKIFHYAFHCDGRLLHPLHVAFVPHDDVLLVLRALAQRMRQARIGHSLDSSVELGPLPTARHMNAMKETIEAAVAGGVNSTETCGSTVRFQHVCGGFEVALPAGFFCTPCVLYGNVANEAPGVVSSLVRHIAQLRAGLDGLGGGPLSFVCAYDPSRQLEELRAWGRDSHNYAVVHDW